MLVAPDSHRKHHLSHHITAIAASWSRIVFFIGCCIEIYPGTMVHYTFLNKLNIEMLHENFLKFSEGIPGVVHDHL